MQQSSRIEQRALLGGFFVAEPETGFVESIGGWRVKVLFFGATGVIGRQLLPLLVDAGHEVVAVSRGANRDLFGQADGRVQARLADVFDRDALHELFASERPDAVLHQLTDLSSRDFAANSRIRTVGTRNLVDAAKSVAVKSIVAQSIAWVYVPGAEPATEQTPMDTDAAPPRGGMVGAVAALENAVSEIPHHVILRYGMLYGPGTWYDREGWFAQQVRQGAIKSSGVITNFLHVEDAAQAAIDALAWPSGVVNVVDDSPSPASEWLPVYAQEIGAPAPVWDPLESSPVRPVSNEYAHSLGWKPLHPSWKQGFVSRL